MYVSRGRRWPTETKRKSKRINPGSPFHKARHATREKKRASKGPRTPQGRPIQVSAYSLRGRRPQPGLGASRCSGKLVPPDERRLVTGRNSVELKMTLEQIEARVEELAAILEANPSDKDAAREMTRLLADHTLAINKFLY